MKSLQVRKAAYLISSPQFEQCPPADRPEYAFIGRSNVGKSSLINLLAQQEKLAKTSSSPGKTQLINHFVLQGVEKETGKMQDWYFVDLPGYGFAKVSQRDRNRWEQMIEHYFRKRENLMMAFVLIDSRHGPQKVDLDFLDKLHKWEVPVTILFTKTDKENQRVVSKNIRDFFDALKQRWQFLPAYHLTSAVKKSGRDKVLSQIAEINEDWHQSLA